MKKDYNVSDEQFIKECQKAVTMLSVANKLNIPYSSFIRRAKKLGCYKPNQAGKGLKKTKKQQKTIFTVNENYFDNWTEQMAYWLGFLAADGSVSEKKEMFSFGLKETDSYAVEQFCKDIEYSGSIKHYIHKSKGKEYPCARVFIFSRKLKKRLIELGIIPNKSKNPFNFLTNVPQEFKKSFLFGFFDGDGSIGKDGRISFLGSKDICEEIVKIFGLIKYRIALSHNCEKLYELSFYRTQKQFFEDYYFYSLTHFVLRRKKERIQKFLQVSNSNE